MKGWPLDVVTEEIDEEHLEKALKEGPYGRCVYACDNDVVHNQVTIMEFEGNKSASFTMTAFTEAAPRKTRVFGTRGEVDADGRNTLCRHGGADALGCLFLIPGGDVYRHRPPASGFLAGWQIQIEVNLTRPLHSRRARARADGGNEFLGRQVVGR